MTNSELMRQLQVLGTGQNRKVYQRHGVGPNLFGVSFANIGKLQRQIKKDHALAQQLWNSGNHDARLLAAKIADPEAATTALLEHWRKDLDNYIVTDAFAGFVEATSQARKCLKAWTRSKQEWTRRAGWMLLARLALHEQNVSEQELEGYLARIESEIHASPNRARDAMNSALIAIGLRSAEWEKRAIAAARRIGKVDVDHGDTSCKTPDAEAYIRKARSYRDQHGAGSGKKAKSRAKSAL
jgi:3-methyladenine DNA glycosylase AlkD